MSLYESIKRSEVALILFPTACSLTIGEFNMRLVLPLGDRVQKDVKKRTLKTFERHTQNMRAINEKTQKL
jgi:hypothetical protein